MCKNLKKVLWPGLAAGFTILFIGTAVSILLNLLLPSITAEYQNTSVYRDMKDPLMAVFYFAPLVLGFVLAGIWDFAKKLFKGTIWCKGFHFGLMFLALSLPGMMYTYSSFQVSLGAVLTWLFLNWVNGTVAGVVLAKLNK